MTNQEKLESLKALLCQTKTKFWENVSVGYMGVTIPLYIPEGRIAIRIGDDDVWYRKLSTYVHPVIIRDLDSLSFIIEKVNTTMERFGKPVFRRTLLTSRQRSRKNRIKRFCQSLVPEKTYFSKPLPSNNKKRRYATR